jgi:hypothetical protein
VLDGYSMRKFICSCYTEIRAIAARWICYAGVSIARVDRDAHQNQPSLSHVRAIVKATIFSEFLHVDYPLVVATPSHYHHKLHATSPGAISYRTLSPYKTTMTVFLRDKRIVSSLNQPRLKIDIGVPSAYLNTSNLISDLPF